MNSFICFDLEGPLSPQDNAYELMKLFPNGDKVFEVLSRYDDLLTLEKREDYEPGDTLMLIIPFLIGHHISESDLINLAREASLTNGALKLISDLQLNRWKVFCITTAYQQYALHLTNKLDIYAHNVASTPLPLDKLHLTLSEPELALLQQVEKDILTMMPITDDARIKQDLDSFFRERLPATNLGRAIQEIKPVGGQRKLDALNQFTQKNDQPLSNWVVVGDSITDFKMLQAVDDAGGLAIAFNANQYALPHATIGLASKSIYNLSRVLKVWQKTKRQGVEKLVRKEEQHSGSEDNGYFHWLSGRKDLSDVIQIHQRMRKLVREDAAKLG